MLPGGGWQAGGKNATIPPVQVPLLLLADFASVAEGKLNILGVFDEIKAATLPAVHPQMALVAQFRAGRNESGTYKLTVRVIDEDGKKLFDATGDMNIDDQFQEKTLNNVFMIHGLKFEKYGEYSVVALINGEERKSYKFDVRKIG